MGFVSLGKKLKTIENNGIKERIVTNEAVYLPINNNGVVLVISKARTGKSAHMKNIAMQIGEDLERPLLIIDSMGKGEWVATKKPNYSYHAKYSRAFEKLKVIKNFTLPLSEFDSANDFYSLGFSEEASHHMAEWVKDKELRSPKKMTAYLEEMLDEKTPIFWQTKYNLVTHWHRISDWFYQGKEDNRLLLTSKIFQDIWAKNRWLCLQIDAESGEKYKSIAFVGNLLRNFDDNFLRAMSPVVIIEEADLICPNERFTWAKKNLTSRDILRTWVFKKLRYNLLIFFITQNERLLDEEIVRSGFDKIIGIVDADSRFFSIAKFNKYRNWDGVSRSSFVYVNVNQGRQYYAPDICECGCQS